MIERKRNTRKIIENEQNKKRKERGGKKKE